MANPDESSVARSSAEAAEGTSQSPVVAGLLDDFLAEHEQEVRERSETAMAKHEELGMRIKDLKGWEEKVKNAEFEVGHGTNIEISALVMELEQEGIKKTDVISGALDSIEAEYRAVEEAIEKVQASAPDRVEAFKEKVFSAEIFNQRISELFQIIKDEYLRLIGETTAELTEEDTKLSGEISKVRAAIADLYEGEVLFPEFEPDSLEVKRMIFERRLRKAVVDPVVKRMKDRLDKRRLEYAQSIRVSRKLFGHYTDVLERYDWWRWDDIVEKSEEEGYSESFGKLVAVVDKHFESELKLLDYVQNVSGPVVVSRLVDDMVDNIRRSEGEDVDRKLKDLFDRTDLSFREGDRYQILEDPKGYAISAENTKFLGGSPEFLFKDKEIDFPLYRNMVIASLVLTSSFAQDEERRKEFMTLLEELLIFSLAEGEERDGVREVTVRGPGEKREGSWKYVDMKKVYNKMPRNYSERLKEFIKILEETDYRAVVDVQMMLAAGKEFGIKEIGDEHNAGDDLSRMALSFMFSKIYPLKGANGVCFDSDHREEADREIKGFSKALKDRAAAGGISEPVLTLDDAKSALEKVKTQSAEAVGRYRSEVGRYRSEAETLKADSEELAGAREALEKEVKDAKGSLEELLEEKRGVEQALHKERTDKYNIDERKRTLGEKVEGLRIRISGLERDLASTNSNLEARDEKIKDLRTRLDKIISDLEDEVEELKSQKKIRGRSERAAKIKVIEDFLDKLRSLRELFGK